MKKKISLFVSACLLAAISTGCLPESSEVSVSSDIPLLAASVEQDETSSRPAIEAEVPEPAIFLPAPLSGLGDELQEMAKQEGFTLQVLTAPAGSRYAARLAEEIKSNENLVLFWAQGEEDAQALQKENVRFGNLADIRRPAALRALAKLTPEQTRLLETKKIFGLPLGLYGEGTLVDLSMITALLGSSDKEMVRADLTACTIDEWTNLVNATSEYLQKPQNITLQLGNNNYTLQRYRPEEARQLRTIHALPTGEPGAMLWGSLSAALSARYATPAALLAATKGEQSEAMQLPLEAMFSLLEAQTLNMSSADGPLARGEGFAGAGLVSNTLAQTLFGEGSALFLQADTRTGLRLEAEYPRLNGKLALIPIKLPLPHDDAASALARSMAVATNGTLCINAQAPSQQAAEVLLLRLFGSQEGQAYIERELGLVAYSNPYPENPLQAQVAAALSTKDTHPIVLNPNTMESASTTIGKWVQSEMLYIDTWEEEKLNAAMTVARTALGYPLGQEETQK